MKKLLIGCLVFILILGFSTLQAHAFSLGVPFGGRITSSIVCTCPADPGWQITVGPPHPGVYMYVPGATRLFSNFNIYRPGAYVLGIAIGYSPCMQVSPTGCIPSGPGGLIMRLVGTSL